jgi:AcrR family transcriptional regulator
MVAPAGFDEDVRDPLPRGRHALSRTQVAASQRARLVRAMTDEVAERGLATTTVAGVFQRAGVSSRAFYEHFNDLRDAFLAAYEACVDYVIEATLQPGRVWGGDPDDRGERDGGREGSLPGGRLPVFGAMLHTYLRLVASRPNIARTFLVEVYAAGPEALRRRLEVHDRFVAGVAAVLAPDRRLDPWEALGVEALVDAITFRVTRLVVAEGLGDIDTLCQELIVLTERLCPWVR